jgi:hypothetical protein
VRFRVSCDVGLGCGFSFSFFLLLSETRSIFLPFFPSQEMGMGEKTKTGVQTRILHCGCHTASGPRIYNQWVKCEVSALCFGRNSSKNRTRLSSNPNWLREVFLRKSQEWKTQDHRFASLQHIDTAAVFFRTGVCSAPLSLLWNTCCANTRGRSQTKES